MNNDIQEHPGVTSATGLICKKPTILRPATVSLSLSLSLGPGTQTDTEAWNTYLLDFPCLLLRADLPPKSLTNPLLCIHCK
ncbi:hypothetical protein AMECASPLE_029354 [Ameca splendens]|uniref:Uncharacterized protein n=1 Tax=Ameca splendens TaxID=208324 RepID=A0ABV0ZH27_9TELE